MIYITGDVHYPIDSRKLFNWAVGKIITSDDILIVCGDMGAVWDQPRITESGTKLGTRDSEVISDISKLPFKILFVDGNHENHAVLNALPTTDMYDGKVHRLSSNLIHLMRGQIYSIDTFRLFTLGGASSIDRAYRTKNISWWEEEVPSQSEIDFALHNLQKFDNKVDFIITHDCPSRVLSHLYQNNKCTFTSLNASLEQIASTVEFKHWYFGHHHVDKTVGTFSCLYDQLKSIE